MKTLATIVLLVFVIVLPARAAEPVELSLPMVFSDGMVLQRAMPVPVWGKAEPGAKVTVTLLRDGAEPIVQSAQVEPIGRWMLLLPKLSAGGPVKLRFDVNGQEVVTLQDVLIGEVWICSGQSNMKFRLRGVRDAKKELATADQPTIRLLHVWPQVRNRPHEIFIPQPDGRKQTTRPATTLRNNAWSHCNAETARRFSAVGYLFGRELHKELDVPVGLICAAWGGTPAEAWTPTSVLQANPECKPMLDAWRDKLKTYNLQAARKHYNKRLARWKTQADKAKQAGRKPPRKPRFVNFYKHPQRPGVLFNGMIHPLVPFAVRGVIWYQGENNALRAWQYRTLFPQMITAWRQQWSDALPPSARPIRMPFYWVSLANFRQPRAYQDKSTWAELRDAQTQTLSLPDTGQALAIDVGEANNIHPRNKQTVAERLARVALAETYGRDVIFRGPTLKKMTVDGSTVTLEFANVGHGLTVKGEDLKGFALAGADKTFHPAAKAYLDGSRVILSHPDVPAPVAVRYNWADNPIGTLYNSANLPAEPFRTDDWPLTTQGKVIPRVVAPKK